MRAVWVVVCLAAAGCDCDGVRLMGWPKGDALQVFARDVASCGNASVLLEPVVAGGVPPYEYAWTPTDGLADPSASAITVPGDTRRSFELTVTDSGGHSRTVAMQVVPRGKPTAQLAFVQGGQRVCDGDGVQFDASQSHAEDGGSIVTYRWNAGDGSDPVESASAQSPVLVPTNGQQVQLTVVDDAGCEATAVQPLSVRGRPRPQAAFVEGSAQLCRGAQVQLDASASRDADGNAVAAYAWDVDGDPATQESSVPASGRFVPDGHPAQLTVTDAVGCSATLEVPLDVHAPPTARIRTSRDSTLVCAGVPFTLDGSGSTDDRGAPVTGYRWDLDGDPLSVESSDAQTPLALTSARSVHLTVTDQYGCTADTALDLTPRALPQLPLVVVGGRPDGCAGDQLTLSADGARDADGNPITAFAWDVNGDGKIDATGATTQLTEQQPGQARVTVTDAQGCSTSGAVDLRPQQLPTPRLIFVLGAAESCGSAQVQLDASGSRDALGNAVAQFAWDLDGGGTIDCTSSRTNPFLPTTKPVQLTVTDAHGCRASLVQPIVQHRLPSAAIQLRAGTVLACEGTSVALDGSGSRDEAGSVPQTFAWDLDGDPSTVESTLVQPPAFALRAASDVHLTVTDQNGCSSSTTQHLAVRPLPTPRLNVSTPGAQLCAGDVVQLSSTGSLDADGKPVTKIAWDLDGTPQSIESRSEVPPAFTVQGARTVTLTVTDAMGCSAQAATALSPRSLPTGQLSFLEGRGDVCLGGQVTFGVTGARDADGNAVSNIAWDVDSNGTTDGTGSRSPTFTAPGPQTTTVAISDARGCTRRLSQYVTPRALPRPDIRFVVGAELVCSGSRVQLDASGSRDADGQPVTTFAWDTDGDGRSDQTTARTSTFTPARTESVGLVVTDALGCRATVSRDVAVRALPTARIEVSQGSASMCAGSRVRLSGAVSTDADGKPVASYAWDLDGIPRTIESTAASPAAFVPTRSRTSTLTVTDALGCRGAATQALVVYAPPAVDAGQNVQVCAGGSARLGGAATAGVTYGWSPAEGLDDPAASNPRATPAQTTVYTVTATSREGCTAQASVEVDVRPLPVADAGPDRVMAANGSTQLLGGASGGTRPYRFAWTPADSVTDAASSQPRALPASDTTYALQVTDANGCQGRDSTLVQVLPALTVNAGVDQRLCLDGGTSVHLAGAAASGVAPLSYRWTAQPACAGCIASPASPATDVSPTVDTVFTVTVTDANGTSASDSLQVHVLDHLAIDAGPDRAVGRGETTILGSSRNPITDMTYGWSCSRASCGLSDPASPQPTARPDGTTVYTVHASDGRTCEGEDTVVVYADPTVLATVPTEGYAPWPRDAPLFVVFDTEMDPASFAGNVHLIDPVDGSRIWIAVRYDVATRMLMVQPLDSCPSGACDGEHRYWNNRVYTLRLTGGPGGVRIGSIPPVPLYSDFLLTFTASSVGDGACPQLAYTQPARSGVAAPGTSVVIRFDEPADPRTVNGGTVFIAGVPASVSYDPRTWTATLRPTLPLPGGRTWVVNVVGVQDGNGNPTATSFSFTTRTTPDTTPPAIVAASPAASATEVDLTAHMRVTFTEPVDTRTLHGLQLIDLATTQSVPGRLLYDEESRTLDFEPQSFLEPRHDYRLDVSGVLDQVGNVLAAPVSARFTTQAALLAERFDAPLAGWTLQSPWGLDPQAARAGASGLSDSPGGTPPTNDTRLAQAPVLDVTGRSSVTVSFWSQRLLATDQDVAALEYSYDDATWTAASTLLGPAGWGAHSLQVPTSGRTRLFLRLRVTTDAANTLDGLFLDDFVVR